MEKRFREASFYALFPVVATAPLSISLFLISVGVCTSLALLSMAASRNFGVFKSVFAVFAGIYVAAHLLSITQTEYLYESMRGLLKVLRGVLLCFSALHAIDSRQKAAALFQWMLVVAFIVGADALAQGAMGADLLRGRRMTPYFGETRRLTGPFHHANDFSAYLSLVFFFFLGMLPKGRAHFKAPKYIFVLAGLALLFLCLLWTYSRGAWIAVAAGFVAMTLARRDKILLMLLAAAVGWTVFLSPPLLRERALSLASPQDTVTERKALWSESLRMIREHPWLGLGLNTYAKNEPRYKKEGSVAVDYQYAHNGYLQMAAETGLIGLASFLAVTACFFWISFGAFARAPDSLLKNAGLAALFGVLSFLIHSATDTDLHSLLHVNHLWLVMGFVLAVRKLLLEEP